MDLVEMLATMKPKDDLGQEDSSDFSGLGLMTMLRAIEGCADAKVDRSPTPLESTPTLEFQ
jgi:hypothetical protein